MSKMLTLSQIAEFKYGMKYPFIDPYKPPKPRRIGTEERNSHLANLARGGNELAAKELLALQKAEERAAKKPKKEKKKRPTAADLKVIADKKKRPWCAGKGKSGCVCAGCVGHRMETRPTKAEARAKADLAKLPAANKPKSNEWLKAQLASVNEKEVERDRLATNRQSHSRTYIHA